MGRGHVGYGHAVWSRPVAWRRARGRVGAGPRWRCDGHVERDRLGGWVPRGVERRGAGAKGVGPRGVVRSSGLVAGAWGDIVWHMGFDGGARRQGQRGRMGRTSGSGLHHTTHASSAARHVACRTHRGRQHAWHASTRTLPY